MSSARGSWTRRAVAVLATAAVLLAGAVPVRASGPFAFSSPAATSQFNVGVDFSIDLLAGEAPARVDLELTFPGSIGPSVATLPNTPPAGRSTLRYALDTSGPGHLMPNTPIGAVWAAYPAGGGLPVRSAPVTYRYTDGTQAWQSLTSGIVTVHWTQGSRAFAQRAAGIAVKAVTGMATTLGVPETGPLDFFIYADDAGFRAAIGPGARQNVGGEAVTEIRTLFAEFTPDILDNPWVGVTITHELTHQVIADATDNPYRSPPRWLNEGTAVYESEGNTASYQARLASAIKAGEWWSLDSLGWQFPTDPDKTVLGYAESVSAVDYLVRTYGKDALTRLILAYRAGPTDDEALQSAIGRDMSAFQDDWYASLGSTGPTPFGPQPALPGPLPPDWAGPAATAAPGTSEAATETAPGRPSSPAGTPVAAPAPGPGGGPSGGDATLALVAAVVLAGVLLAAIVIIGRRAAAS